MLIFFSRRVRCIAVHLDIHRAWSAVWGHAAFHVKGGY